MFTKMMWMPAVLCSSGLAESVTCTGCMAIVREATARAAQQQREFGNMHTHVQMLHIVLTTNVDLRLAIKLFLCVGILGWELHVCGNSDDERACQHAHVAILAALVWEKSRLDLSLNFRVCCVKQRFKQAPGVTDMRAIFYSHLELVSVTEIAGDTKCCTNKMSMLCSSALQLRMLCSNAIAGDKKCCTNKMSMLCSSAL